MSIFLIDISSFLGRFHPLLVHFPIGFLVIAILMEWRLKDDRYKGAITYTWFLTGILASIASLCGWFLANDGAYDNWTLFIHRWSGISIAIVSFYGWWIRRKSYASTHRSRKLTSLLSVLLILIAGHFGGNMTHGSDYLLEYAPQPVKNIFGYDGNSVKHLQFNNPDSVTIYKDILAPLFEKKCSSCHNEKVQNGGLDMTSEESLSIGGDNGAIIKPRDFGSEIIRRVTLPFNNSKFMPSTGVPLTYHEIRILEWWISGGADYNSKASELKADPGIQSALLSRHSLDLTPRPWIEKKIVPHMDSVLLSNLESANWKVYRLAKNNGWVEISIPKDIEVTTEMIEVLLDAKEQITWLNLKNAKLEDKDIVRLSSLSHLSRLQIQDNNISTAGLKNIVALSHLESLNLIGTNVDDGVFDILQNLPALKSIYLWKTKVSQDGLAQAKANFPKIDIVHFSTFE